MTDVLEAAATPVATVCARLRQTFESGRTRPLQWRLDQFAAIERLLDERESSIATALAQDLGRSAHESWLGDVAATRAEAAFAAKNLRRWTRHRRVPIPLALQPGRAQYRYEPLGVVLIIGPWNYPFHLVLGPLIGAIAAGNCAVIKPSEHAPASSALLAGLIPEYLDQGAFAVVEGEAQVTQDLLDQALDHVFFTGGPDIGRKIMEGASRHLTPVTLELGGKSPVVVMADADLEVAARRVVWAKLLNAGQTCVAPDYVLVEASVSEAFLAAVTKVVTAFRKGEPPAQRVVNARQHARLQEMLAASGGDIVIGSRTTGPNLTIQPTVVSNPAPESRLMQEEIFGPVLPVVTFTTFEDAVRRIRAGTKPLAAYLFTSSSATKEAFLDLVSAGGIVINHIAFHALVPGLPFGGVGTSGMGAYHGKWGFETFSHRKSVLAKPARPDVALLYPPYTRLKSKLMRRFM